MNTAIDQLFNLPSDKKEGDAFAEMLKKEIPLQRNPLNILVILKVFEKVLKDILTNDDLDVCYFKDFEQHAKDNKLLINGATIFSQEFGVKYDYSNDTEWVNIDNAIKSWAEKKKKLEEILKSDKIKTAGKQKLVVKL